MALQTLSKTGIVNNSTVEAWHVTQSVDAFTGQVGYDITISGSFNLVNTTGSGLWGETLRVDMDNSGFGNGNYTIPFLVSSGSGYGTFKYSATAPKYNPIADVLYVTSSQAISSSQAVSASYTQYGTNALTYGSFSDQSTQTVLQNTSASLTFGVTDLANGINIGVPSSKLVVTKTGIYNLQFSVQIALDSGAQGTAYLWLRKNGVNQTYTNTGVHLQSGTDQTVAAWNFVLSLNAGDYLELVMWSQGADISALAETPVPGAGGNGDVGVPSIIATLTQIT